MKPTILLAAASLAALLPSCNLQPGGASLAAYQAYDLPTKLPTNPNNVRVKVSLSKQRVYVMEGSTMLLAMPVSVGAPGGPVATPPGSYTIFNKDEKHRASTHGYAYSGNKVTQTYLAKKPAGWAFKGTPMPYWCEFKPNYGFHTGWVKHQPCTHGCIRMHENLSPKFFRLVKVGTPVTIAYSQPEDATITIKLSPDAGPLPDYPDLKSMYVGEGYFSQHKTPNYN
ncbi:MAG: L,D-transpeptidase [Verrucomicrobia bacterium]|nr:MAG: L,D-transpeptidase [Verrucomicrobiota bacterium]